MSVYKWGDRSVDKGLSETFAWLLNLADPDQDAIATVYANGEQYGDDLYHWTASLAPATATGFVPAEDVRGVSETMDEAKRACEKALSLDICPLHSPRNLGTGDPPAF